MKPKYIWNENSLKFNSQKSHNQNIVGICLHSENTFLTSSEDKTMRLWDLRTQSSVKLFRNPCLTQELSNPATDSMFKVFVGSKDVFEFQLRKEQIFVEKLNRKSEHPHYDLINNIIYCKKRKQLLCCDDEGDIRAYSTVGQGQNLDCTFVMQQEHTNICNSVEYVYSESKMFEQKRLCLSGGFDSVLVLWSIQDQKPIKKIPIQQVLSKMGIKSDNQNYPFIHKISTLGSNALLALETGHVLCLPVTELRKPKFILQASLTRLNGCKVFNLNNSNILVSWSSDETFSLFNYDQRVDGCPKFLQKYAAIQEPVQIDYLDGTFLAVTNSPVMSFYKLKI